MVAGSTITGVQATAPAPVPLDHAPVSLASTVYTLRGVVPWPLDETLSGAVCGPATGNTCSDFEYPILFGDMGIAWGADMLDDALQNTATPTTVFGYSEGAAVASKWLSTHAQDPDAPSPSDLHFILTGNPQRKYGGARNIYPWTPVAPTTAYTVLDVAREYDAIADAPDDWWNVLALMNASWGYLFVHTSYTPVDLTADEKLVWQDGNTTYVLVRTPDLPLLMPLRLMGLGFLADALNAPLKAIIDSAYHRDYPGIITDPVAAQKVVDDALQGKSGALTTSADTTSSLARAAAVTAAALVSNQNTEAAAEPAETKDQAPTQRVEQPAEAAKALAVEKLAPDASVETPQSTDPSTEAPKADSESEPDAEAPTADNADTAEHETAASTEASDQDEDAHVGRHRAPDATPAAPAAPATEAAPKASTASDSASS